MSNYLLRFNHGPATMISGLTIGEACREAGLDPDRLVRLQSFEHNGTVTQVAATASCGCVYHAEEGSSCVHDLQLHGLIS